MFYKKIKSETKKISYDFIWSHKSPFNPNYKKPKSIFLLLSLPINLLLNIFDLSKKQM